MSKKKIIKTVIICIVFVALLAGLITMMVLPQDYSGKDKDSLEIGTSDFGQRMLIGLQVAVLGIGMVFVVLILLILMVMLMRLIFQGVVKLKKKQTEKNAQSLPAQDVAVVEDISSEDDEEVVAVIMAAINAYYESQNVTYKSNLKFRVRSIKEI